MIFKQTHDDTFLPLTLLVLLTLDVVWLAGGLAFQSDEFNERPSLHFSVDRHYL